MSDKAKKAGSFFILSTYVTSLAIAVTIFAGTVLKGAYDNSNELIAIEQTMKNMESGTYNIQQQMGELFKYHHITELKIKEHELLLNRCIEDIRSDRHFHERGN